MSEYKYCDPLKHGYKEFYLTKKQHNNLFPHRPRKFGSKFKYYISNNYIRLDKYNSVSSIILITILFPISVLINGTKNFKEICNEMYRLYHQKETGDFTGDIISSSSDTYQKVLNLIK